MNRTSAEDCRAILHERTKADVQPEGSSRVLW